MGVNQCQRITFQVIYIMNFLVKVIKKNVWFFKVWFVLLLLIKITLKTAQLPSKHCASNLSAMRHFSRVLLQFFSQVFSILYMFILLSFVFKSFFIEILYNLTSMKQGSWRTLQPTITRSRSNTLLNISDFVHIKNASMLRVSCYCRQSS